MRIAVLGAGPAGLYFSLLMKKADPSHRITVVERNPPDATFGWGVVFSEETLGAFRDADVETHTAITESFAKWNAIDVLFRGETVRSRGHVFSGMARKELLQILQRRCFELGVELRFHEEVDDVDAFRAAFPDADLVVAADGVNSRFRERHADVFEPTKKVHPTRFVWFGTDLVFEAFTFIFRDTPHGMFQVHGYPFDARTSTFIVECRESTWRAAGLQDATEEESIAFCQSLFAEELAGHRLMSNRSMWVNFVTLKCEAWHVGNLVLLGDACHTAHFTIGSGTKLAMEDAVALAQSFQRHKTDLEAALTEYELERQPVVERFQLAALDSSTYFENVWRYAAFEPIQFAFNLLTRSGRIGHSNLQMRDPEFARRVDAWFGGAANAVVAAPPAFVPFRLGRDDVANRVTSSLVGEDLAVDGTPPEGAIRRLLRAAEAGVGLVLTEPVAVTEAGRITPGSPGIYRPAQADAWRAVLAGARGGTAAKVGLVLGHAGRRGATRARRDGIDRPLEHGSWPLVSASPLPYAPRSPAPAELKRPQMVKLLDDFRRAADRANDAGFDLLLVDMAHGYLLSSFLSPLANVRDDRYGGPLEARMRFPLEVFDAVRALWPQDRPLGVRLLSSDQAAGGFGLDDAVAVARELKEHGCDLIQPLAGQTTVRARPEFGRGYQVPAADRICNEAGVLTIAGGNITTLDEANTILAAGRADLVVVDFADYTYTPR